MITHPFGIGLVTLYLQSPVPSNEPLSIFSFNTHLWFLVFLSTPTSFPSVHRLWVSVWVSCILIESFLGIQLFLFVCPGILGGRSINGVLVVEVPDDPYIFNLVSHEIYRSEHIQPEEAQESGLMRLLPTVFNWNGQTRG